MALGCQIVDFGGPDFLNQPDQVCGICHVAEMQQQPGAAFVRIPVEMIDAAGIERRRPTLHAMKITRAVAAIHYGLEDRIYLGNLDAKRDWGHARDYVEGMWRILQQPKPDDYVLATGETHSVREFVELAFHEIGREIAWTGEGIEEKGLDAKTGAPLVEVDAAYFRPTEVDVLLGDPSKAAKILGWSHQTTFSQLVKEMVSSDLALMKAGAR